MINQDSFSEFNCGIEDYTHPQVVQWGGFTPDETKHNLYKNKSW
jgi:hypothetical protein